MPVDQDQRVSFGGLLLAARRMRGLTQEELAEASGLSVRAIRDMERGRVQAPQRRTVAILAESLRLADLERSRFLAVARAGRPQPGGDMTPVGSPGGPVPAELPAALGDLTGRDSELATLRMLAAAAGTNARSTPTVVSISGPPGVGKTSLAVYAGHQLRDQFPGGQLYVDLRGTAADRLDVAEALAGLLRSLGLPDGRLPASVAGQAALYRTLSRDRRLLLLLDNAGSEAQVRPLLPAGAHCLVLVTSRRPLAGLEAVHRLPLGVLPDDQAVALLAAVVGGSLASADPEAVEEVARLCGRLPLALRIAGNRLASRPHWSVGQLVGQLRAQRLTALTAGDLAVRAAFAVSYQQLDPAVAAVFRLASVIPGPHFGPDLVAVAAGIPEPAAAAAAEELVDAGLLLPDGDRYRYHDLMLLYAGERLESDEPRARQAASRDQVMTWLLRRSGEAGQTFEPRTRPAGRADDHATAAAWLDRESGNWVAALRQAVRTGRHTEVCAVTRALHWYSDTATHRHPWDEIFALGVDAARAIGDPRQEAVLLNFLGWARYFCRERYADGLAAHRRALALARQTGDRREEGWALVYTASIMARTGRAAAAVRPSRRAAELFQEIGYDLGEASALGMLGSALAATGHLDEALTLHRRVLFAYRRDRTLSRIGSLVAQGGVTMRIAQDLAGLRRWREAVRAYARARRILRRGGDRFGEAQAAYQHGLALREHGETAAAQEALRHALLLFAAASSPAWEARTRAALTRLPGGNDAASRLPWRQAGRRSSRLRVSRRRPSR